VAIVLGGVGLAFHSLWIAAVVLMAVLWGYMASDIRSRGGGVVSDLVGTVVGEAKEVVGATPDNDSQGEGRETVEADGQAPPLGTSDDQEPTRRELYAQAQEADIQGRSGMSKDELKQALKG
jgi:hypothetical protein